jgi:RNA polymerase sigma-70 factor, ECF subfamily
MSGRSHPVLDKALMAVDDTLLIIAIQSRDRAALTRLYLRYHRRLTRFVARTTSRHEDIEEIINDTFMVVWTHASAFRFESLVSTWIIGIAYRLAMHSLRRRKRQLPEWNAGVLVDQSADPARNTEEIDWLDCALGRLPVDLRTTMTLAYQIGFSVAEISQMTKTPAGTVKSRMFHARLKLRDAAEELGGEVDSISPRARVRESSVRSSRPSALR